MSKESPDKRKELKRLFSSLAGACEESALFKGVPLVFSTGPVPCALIVVGEAPGRDEVRLGAPFVGRAGKYLVSVLEDVFKKDREEIYITNVVKVWPVIQTKRGKTRKPLKEEEEFFIPYLDKEIEIVSPEVILAVGKTAFSALAPDRDFTPGTWVEGSGGRLIMPVYHPAYILRRHKMLKENTGDLKAALRKVRKKVFYE